jgi:zona occludens toxin
MLKSPTLLVGILGFLVAVAWFAFGGWLSGVKSVPPMAPVSTLPAPPLLPVAPVSQPVAPAHPVSVPVVQPIRIQGGVLTEVHGAPQWLYVSESGRIMTDEEIAMVSGGIVNARMDRGVRILSGSGVLWGGAASTPTASSPIPVGGGVLPAPTVATTGAEERAPGEEAPPVPAGHRAKDLLASPPGLLATPPDLR